MQVTQRLPYLWDYDLDQMQFREILNGHLTKGQLNQDWAACRLLEYAPYAVIFNTVYQTIWIISSTMIIVLAYGWSGLFRHLTTVHSLKNLAKSRIS